MTQSQLFEYTYPIDALSNDGALVTVQAVRTATPGLIITPYDAINPPKDFRGKQFVITHEATGAKIVRNGVRLSLRVARLAAGALGGVCDWSFTDRESGSKIAWEALTATGMRHWLRDELGA